MSVLLSKPVFPDISPQELAQQLSGKNKAKNKLPTWFQKPGIYYPPNVNLEQTSSEITGRYKAELVRGETMADLTGGFGVDTYFFSKAVPLLIHCELDEELHEIAQHNAKVLGVSQVQFHHGDGIAFLKQTDKTFDWIFLDPGRRTSSNKKVFLLSDCEPDVILHRDLLLHKGAQVMVKTSPMLDLKAGIEQFGSVAEIHVVAVENEVKELLWILQKDATQEKIEITAVNLTKGRKESLEFRWIDERSAACSFGPPLDYLYEPHSALLKAGAFKTVCKTYAVDKLHEHSHLYTSREHLSFPGRSFRIDQVIPFNKKNLRRLKGEKANVSARNFPLSVAGIRKKFGIKDGGEVYLFFTTNNIGENIVIQSSKISSPDIPT
ncbi:class I SAM-dependent methyltransferase [Muriicola jejuensis]|nr:class I SAM-dependent methyltransferase [Muriicola jejuensis]